MGLIPNLRSELRSPPKGFVTVPALGAMTLLGADLAGEGTAHHRRRFVTLP